MEGMKKAWSPFGEGREAVKCSFNLITPYQRVHKRADAVLRSLTRRYKVEGAPGSIERTRRRHGAVTSC